MGEYEFNRKRFNEIKKKQKIEDIVKFLKKIRNVENFKGDYEYTGRLYTIQSALSGMTDKELKAMASIGWYSFGEDNE